MKRLTPTLLLCLTCGFVRAQTYTIVYLNFTNTSGTTNGQVITANGDARTFTNSVVVPSTQVPTNATAAGSMFNFLTQIASFHLSGVTNFSALSTTEIRLVSFPDAPLTVTASAGFASVTYAPTNNSGTNIPVIVPFEFLPLADQTNVANGVVDILNSGKNTTPLNVGGLSGTDPVFHHSLAVTNDGTGNSVIISNGVIVAQGLILPGGTTNQAGYTTFTNLASGYFLGQGLDGVVRDVHDAQTLTNLIEASSMDIPISELFTNNLGDGATLSPAAFGWLTNAGLGAILQHTNGTSAITNVVRFRKALPWDWNGGTVKVGLLSVCTGDNSAQATNCVFAIRAAATPAGTGLDNPPWGTLARVTNSVATGALTNGVEGVTAALTVGGAASSTNGILWEIQRHGGDAGDTETNADLFVSQIRIYYQSNTRTNFPSSSP